MPKRKIHFVPGGYYHIYNRGAGRQSIFREERNYLYLLRLLKQVASECRVTVIAYCLLPNHYHWLVRQEDDIPAARLPTRVFGSYSQAFNRAFERTGTLFEGPYKAVAIESDVHLLHLCRYIHLNPVRHGLVSAPDDWRYSNYLEWVQRRPGTLVDHAFVCDHFDSPQMYQEFVEAYRDGLAKPPESLQRYLDSLDLPGSSELPGRSRL